MRHNRSPSFNLKAVVQQTGVKPDTLRAWERRYGLPQPQRSEGGQRLYTERDIQVIRWLVARQQEGLSIRRAVELWHGLEVQGQDPLRPTGRAGQEARAMTLPRRRAEGRTLQQLRTEWLHACLAFDERAAEQVLAHAFALYPADTVALNLLQAAMAEVGEGWYRGEVTVQQEHFATELAVRRLEALIAGAPPPTQPGRILAACPPGEKHTLGLLLITFLLRWRGWEVVYLGAGVPAERLESTLAIARPRLAILAAQRLQAAANLLELAEPLRRKGILVAFGGLIFTLLPALRTRIPGHFLGETVEDVPERVEALLATPPAAPDPEPVPPEYVQARAHFQDCRARIEASVWEALRDQNVPAAVIEQANRELGDGIDAALALGEMRFLGSDLAWLAGLLANHQASPRTLAGYLAAYRRAARACLDDRRRPVIDWLAELDV